MTDRACVREDLYRSLGWISYEIPWLSEDSVYEVNEQRRVLLSRLRREASFSFDNLKAHHGPLSPGCQACGTGTWSCLFINHACNASCFWCLRDPDVRREMPPSAHGLDFATPDLYADFLLDSGYRAVGFSGGEPFLAFPKLLAYTRGLRERLGNSAWLWVYTNGTLVTKEKVETLARAGLNEVRVDLAAHDYDLAPIRLMAGLVPVLTVEIPCLPEDEQRLADLLPQLEELGIKHLNLHQLTANLMNIRGYMNRSYTFLHHPLLTVLESEFAAMRTVLLAAEQKIRMGVQVCTKPYKQAAQGRSRRLRALEYANYIPDGQTVTEAGYLRERVTTGSTEGEGRAMLSPALRYFEPRLTARSGGRAIGSGLQKQDLLMITPPVGEVYPLNETELAWLQIKHSNSENYRARTIPERLHPWERFSPEEDEVF